MPPGSHAFLLIYFFLAIFVEVIKEPFLWSLVKIGAVV